MSPALCSTWSCAAHTQLWYGQHCTSLWCDLGPALEMAVSVYVAVEYMVGLPTKMAQDCWACRMLENTSAIQGQLLALCSLRLILVTLLLVHGQFLHLTDHRCCIVGLLKCNRENSNVWGNSAEWRSWHGSVANDQEKCTTRGSLQFSGGLRTLCWN